MSKQKSLLSLIALVCAVLALGLSVAAVCLNLNAGSRMAALEQENKFLQQQLNTLSAAQGQPDANALCYLMVNGWEANLSELLLTSATAEVAIPEGSEITGAHLVLRKGIEELTRKSVTLHASASFTGYEATLENIRFDLPALAENEQVDVWLEVVLSNGQILLSASCGWYCFDGELLMVAG